MDGEEFRMLAEAPMGVIRIVVPLPGELQLRGGSSEEGGGRDIEIVDEIGGNVRCLRRGGSAVVQTPPGLP